MKRRVRRREFLRATLAGAAPALTLGVACAAQDARCTKLLVITAEDMNWDTPGCRSGQLAGVTPSIDRLASQGVRFEHAHVTVALCAPSRSVPAPP